MAFQSFILNYGILEQDLISRHSFISMLSKKTLSYRNIIILSLPIKPVICVSWIWVWIVATKIVTSFSILKNIKIANLWNIELNLQI